MRGFLIALVIVSTVDAWAQEGVNKIHMLGKAEEKAILIRIAPGSPTLWELGNKHGYMVERYTVTRGTQYLGNREKQLLTPSPLKPLPMPQWESISANNPFAELAAEALYGETFELSTNFDQDIMQLYNKAKELESRFSFALFAADISTEVAQASGLYLRDTNVKKDERYLYRVYSMVPQNIIRSDTAFIYISLDDYAPLPEIKEVQVQFGDGMAMVSWDTRFVESIYSAYWIERSEDGKLFTRVSDLPYVNMYPENVMNPGRSYKLDSIGNNKIYHYRVLGISPFGETGPPSEVVKGEGVIALGVSPAIRKVIYLNNQATVQWEFPKENESSLAGFEVERSRNTDTGYKKISPRLPADARTFQDVKPEGTNYYRVKALGKNGEAAFSFPTLHQLEDSIPPLPPTGLVGFIDTTGVVTLHWNNNSEEDLNGYRVFRSNFQNSEFSQVTREPVDTSAFIEKIPLQNLSREVYYKIQAIDTRFNPSGFSKVSKLLKPDVVPPVSPVIKSWQADHDKLWLSWAPSSSKDVANHTVKIRNITENGIWTIQPVGIDAKNEYRFDGLKKGTYEVVVEATDSAGNKAVSKKLRVNAIGGIRKPITDVKATADRTAKNVILLWKYDEPKADKILIYRSEGTGNVSLYKTIPGDSKQFMDDQVTINTKYTYYLKVVFKNGEESGFGEKVQIVF
jgi:hypothetical protein